jgi:hypothetical protein
VPVPESAAGAAPLPTDRSIIYFKAQQSDSRRNDPMVYTRTLSGFHAANEFFLKSYIFSRVHDFSRFISLNRSTTRMNKKYSHLKERKEKSVS